MPSSFTISQFIALEKDSVDRLTESSGAPLDKVKGGLCFNGCNRRRTVARYDIATVQKSNGHVFSVSWIADNHLVIGFEALECQVGNLEGLMSALASRNDWRITDQWVMDAF